MGKNVILYTHPTCTICVTVKLELDEKGTSYEEINLAEQPEKWSDLESHTGGERITPVMVDDGEVTIGYHGVGCVFYE